MEAKHLNALPLTVIKKRETSVNLTHIQDWRTENCKTSLVYSSFSFIAEEGGKALYYMQVLIQRGLLISKMLKCDQYAA